MTVQFFKDIYFPKGHKHEGLPVPVSLKIQWEGEHPNSIFKKGNKEFYYFKLYNIIQLKILFLTNIE